MKMFSKPTGKNAEQIEVHPQFKNYLYRYKLNNMLDGKKSTFEEFLSSPFKDNLTEAEAKRFIGFLTAKQKAVPDIQQNMQQNKHP